MARTRRARMRPALIIAALAIAGAALFRPLLFAGGARGAGPAASATSTRAATGEFPLETKKYPDTLVIGGFTIRTFPLVEESPENVSLAASSVASVIGCVVPVVGGLTLSVVLSAAWAGAASKSITPLLEDGGETHEFARAVEDVAQKQGERAIQLYNLAANMINSRAV